METVTLHAEDFKQVHNTLCDLRNLAGRMKQSMIKIEDVESIIEGFEQGLASAYEQDRRAFRDKSEHYDVVKQQEGLQAIWSIYSVEELGEPHPYLDAERVLYKDHWGELPIVEDIPGGTWIDLYIAADRCIRASGDGHHVFIEGFRPSKDGPKTLVLTTGS